jgi:hypothetical protein
VRRWAVFVLIAAVAGCGRDDVGAEQQGAPQKQGGDQGTGGLSLAVSFDEPLRSGGPVTWMLRVTNGGSTEVTLVFRSGKDGDVALRRDGRDVYRWSSTRYFTQAMRQVRLAPGDRKTFPLEERSLSAEAGDYELVAELDSEPAPPPARRSVKVRRG